MTITSPTLYAIYSNSRGFYLGVDRFGRHEFAKNPKYNDKERVLLLKEKEMRELLMLIKETDSGSDNSNSVYGPLDLRLVPTVVSAAFELSEIKDQQTSNLTQEIIKRIKAVWDRCDPEIQSLIDDLYAAAEAAETDAEVFKLRIKKEWTEDSNLYTEKEVEETRKILQTALIASLDKTTT